MPGFNGKVPSVAVVVGNPLEKRLKDLVEGEVIEEATLRDGKMRLEMASGKALEVRVEDQFQEVQ